MTNTQEVPMVVAVANRLGGPATVQDARFESSDPAIVAIVPDPGGDPMKATARAVGPTGEVVVTFKCDADLGDGVREIIGTLAIPVTGAEATVVAIKAGEPVEQA